MDNINFEMCLVCLENSTEVINIHSRDSLNLRIQDILEQHFWFHVSILDSM